MNVITPNVVFPDEYQTTSFQHILNSYFEWEAAGKPGERPFDEPIYRF